MAFKKVFSSIGLNRETLKLNLEVDPPSVSSTEPNLEIVPASTNQRGICPEASHLLVKCEAETEKRLLSSKTKEYFPNKLIRLKF